MATLVLSAIGSAVGGPLGGAIGSLLGRQLDQKLIGNGTVQGPRLKELAVTTSSYGQPVARNFGQVRVAGSIIWATDLVEASDSEGGGKGKPSTTTYSYSISFAVALSSTPISRLGRIWADGSLLRGAQGDLKIPGQIRIYHGDGDDPVDPLIEAERSGVAPAFRDFAYVVFEDLQLNEFGNRIPALTFELFADAAASIPLKAVVPVQGDAVIEGSLSPALGFSDEGGRMIDTLSVINRLIPLSCTTTASGLSLVPMGAKNDDPKSLPAQLIDAEAPSAASKMLRRAAGIRRNLAIRYYDTSRDFQASVQRATGQRASASTDTIDLPATMAAADAKQLIQSASLRSIRGRERMVATISALDPEIGPGSFVTAPDRKGLWHVREWEWSDAGILLELERISHAETRVLAGEGLQSDSGQHNSPRDEPIGQTVLHAFEAPPLAGESINQALIYAAVSSASDSWKGAKLYRAQAGSLIPIGSTDRNRAITGQLIQPLPPSSAILLEPNAIASVQLIDPAMALTGSTIEGLAEGANRLLVGGEVIQFRDAEHLDSGRWNLIGLLRGRGGTEDAARIGHPVGSNITLLDSRITALATDQLQSSHDIEIAAIGRGDALALIAPVSNAGLSRRALSPIHPSKRRIDDSTTRFAWTRRALGQWLWSDQAETPLVEERESYQVGFGSTLRPHAVWIRTTTAFDLTDTDKQFLIDQFGASELWVRQIGTYANSSTLTLEATLS